MSAIKLHNNADQGTEEEILEKNLRSLIEAHVLKGYPGFTKVSTIFAATQESIDRLLVKIKSEPFLWLNENDGKQFIYDKTTNLLWFAFSEEHSPKTGEEKAKTSKIGDIGGWRLPTKVELTSFVMSKKNPMSSGQAHRIYNQPYWLCDTGRLDIDAGYFSVSGGTPARLILCNPTIISPLALIYMALEKGWSLPAGDEKQRRDQLDELRQINLKEALKPLDYAVCRQPLLEEALFTDPNKGLWEAWGLSETEQAQYGVRARDPAQDVREGFVAIDFGTSSTVVAWDNNGKPELMRVGVKDFWAKEQPRDYENPTVLEFIDFQEMLSAWQSTAYRPGVLWDQVRCSHEALHNWRNNESNPQVVGSILGKIKQWAMRQGQDHRLRITDQLAGFEHEFEPLAPRNPVKGQPLTVGTQDAFDPVELYAWFLGMNINWRQRGIFLKYYMSFPVDYPQAVKDNILAAFRRGLQRSLPATLVNQPVFNGFTVEERASEPAAYAAIALPTLGIAPGAGTGEAYAVFDFGGGTADFDFGFYREPDAEEEDEGVEAVFERYGTAGDKFLGGENLLENLAYQTFRHNLDVCREKKIAFTRPLDAEAFPGSEMFLEKTRAASTNTLMLMARLRPLWETGSLPDDGSGVTKLELLTKDGGKVACELAIPSDQLLRQLEQRIERGVQSFYVALRNAFGDDLPQQVHILLAGNASRSQLVSDLFGLNQASATHARMQAYVDNLFGSRTPVFTAHPPLAADEHNVYRPTGKTGVALGLLKLCPGSPLKITDHTRRAAGDEAPFAHHVGRIRLGKFQIGLHQGTVYGEWHELGVPRERVFNLFHTQSALAHTGQLAEGDSTLHKRPLHLAGDSPGHRVYARALKPGQIEICTATSKEAATQGDCANLRTLELG